MSPLRKQKKGSKSPNLPAQFQVISPIEVPFVPVILPRMELSNEATHFVYLRLCANGSIYVGQTRDLSARLVRHSSGSGARHTAGIKPVELIYKEGPISRAGLTLEPRAG
jgi:hypothetical protein